MKSLSNHLAYIVSRIMSTFFPVWKKARKKGLSVVLAIIPFMFTGCFQHYFRTNTTNSADETALKLLQNSNKYFVVHFDSSRVFGLSNVSVSNDKLEGNLVVLPGEHNKYIDPVIDEANRVNKKDKAKALIEVHLYTNNSLGNTNDLALPLSSFNRIDVYTFDKKRTRSSSILSAIGLAATVTFLLVVISTGGT